MKRIFIILVGMLMAVFAYSQTLQTQTENFDNSSVSFSSVPANAWNKNSAYFTSSPYSYRGTVPHTIGDSTILTTSSYDLSNYTNVQLKFKHICKISSMDNVRIEYKINQQGWSALSESAYKGKAGNYNTTGFNAESYPEWEADDSTVMPAQSWWKEEIFDVSQETSQANAVQFRFIIKRGSTSGTQVSYGWLLDDFEITAANYDLNSPIVEFISPLVVDTVYTTGSWEINARVKTVTITPIKTPWLKYTAIQNNTTIETDSILMTMVAGDSLWKTNIPQFPAGTKVIYSITGIDTNGVQAMVSSEYVIAMGEADYVIIGTDPYPFSSYEAPINTIYEYSWSRQLYLSSEFSSSGSGGVITKMAWDYVKTDVYSLTALTQSCYFKVVDDIEISSADYSDPFTDDATLVWQGDLNANTSGWLEITLDDPFVLPPGKNLLIYWNNHYGGYIGEYHLWNHSFTSFYATAYGYSWSFAEAIDPANWMRYNEMFRPNARFFLQNSDVSSIPDNSVAMSSIDIIDTVAITPSASQIPVVVTIKNKGKLNLDSAVINCTVNGNAVSSVPVRKWRGNLPWDYSASDTLGFYSPKINGLDTIVVWVSMPNGVADSKTNDDMLTKVIYCSSDILMDFVNSPTVEVTNTGPFTINAAIRTLSGISVGTTVPLSVTTTYNGISNTVTLNMTFDAADNLWKTTIPHTLFGSNVTYSITLKDYTDNTVSIADSFYIKHVDNRYVIIGTERKGQYDAPLTWEFSWSRQLYLGTEFSPTQSGGTISKLAWYYASSYTPLYCENQRCYFKEVDDVEIYDNYYIDPVSIYNATLVWDGTISADGEGWAEIELDNPFVLSPNKNLLVFWENQYGVYFGGDWLGTETVANSTAFGYDWEYFSTATTLRNLTDIRPNARFYIDNEETAPLDTSVALVAIESPSVGHAVGTSVPIQVRIRNKGIKDLTYCELSYSTNGGTTFSNAVPYNRTLPEDFTDTITIGSFLITNQLVDIIVCVSNPNHVLDPVTKDDTLTFTSVGCSTLSGTKTVGNGKDYPTLTFAMNTIRQCGMTGDLTLELNGTFAENIDLSNMNSSMNGHHLTIISNGKNPDNAIIKPASGDGITLGNNRNITIQAVTVNVIDIDAAIAVRFTTACTNIVIRDCNLLTDTASTSSDVIYKSFTAAADSIFIINNLLDGGVTGFFFVNGTNVSFDSNIVSNQFQYAIFPTNVDLISCSYNTLLSRTTNVGTDPMWYGFFSNGGNSGSLVGNRVIQRYANMEVYGLYLPDFNSYTRTDTGLIANNEIIIISPSTSCNKGISVIGSNLKILHNSIYMSGATGVEPRGIEIEGGASEVKNNNVYLEPSDGMPIYLNAAFSLNQHDIDNNNMYAPTYIGYANGYATTMAEWRQVVVTDLHSVRVLPNYINPAINLDLSSISGMLCHAHPDVSVDINNTPRVAMTTFGAYTQIPVAQDLRLVEITAWEDKCLKDQPFYINVDVQNLCDATSVTTATFRWSLNGELQSPYVWNASPALQPYETRNISIDSFTASDTDKFQIVVWIESLNGQPDPIKWNDTLSAITFMEPLAEFISGANTITDLTFTVDLLVRTKTGAPLSPPILTLQTIVNEYNIVYDTIAMIVNGDIWEANIPQQYFGSKVIYSVTVSDTLNNSITLTDSTYILQTGTSVYPGNDLTISTLISPATWTGASRLCPDEYLPLKVVLTNMGENDYDFSLNNVTLTAEENNAINYNISKTLTDGLLPSGKTDTIEIDPAFPVYIPGQYNIKVWLTSLIDNISYDDTIRSTYTSERLGLPVEEDFEGGLSTEFTVDNVNSNAIWTVVSQGSGLDATVLPQSGSNMLAFTGNKGAMTHLISRQLELRGTLLPSVQFWYFHDTVESEDYMDVFITVDGGNTYTLLTTVYKQNVLYGWKQYTEPLTSYVNGQCINILFEAMEMSFGNVTQYLDNVVISSSPDLKVSEIRISPEISVCDLENKQLSVVLETTTNHAIDFSANPTNLIVEISGSPIATVPLQGMMYGNRINIIPVNTNINFVKGIHNIRAYLSSPVDVYPSNDTVTRIENINPALSALITPLSSANNCLITETDIYQTVTLKNTGDMELSDMELTLQIDTGDLNIDNYITIKDTYNGTIAVGDSVSYTFINAYEVPRSVTCYLRLTADMSCNPSLVHTITTLTECADLNDISITGLVNPSGQTDMAGTTENIVVSIKNESDNKSFTATITALIENENGVALNSRVGTVNIGPSSIIPFTFMEGYNVPSDSVYYIRIYLNKTDNYPKNDTLFMKRYTTNVGIESLNRRNGFTLSQNIPNPANNTTRIDYNVPDAGNVIFHVYSISGQLLYSQTVEVESGDHRIELNTTTFAAGIYFYSMEYKGQRLVKRMSVE
jgi:hypothetical protein